MVISFGSFPHPDGTISYAHIYRSCCANSSIPSIKPVTSESSVSNPRTVSTTFTSSHNNAPPEDHVANSDTGEDFDVLTLYLDDNDSTSEEPDPASLKTLSTSTSLNSSHVGEDHEEFNIISLYLDDNDSTSDSEESDSASLKTPTVLTSLNFSHNVETPKSPFIISEPKDHYSKTFFFHLLLLSMIV